LSLTL